VNGLEGLTAGDPVVVYLGGGEFSRRAVTRVARVWLTDDHGGRHRILDGMGMNDGTITVALTDAQHAAAQAAQAAAEAARRQNSAAECAQDAAQALRTGDIEMARALLSDALDCLALYAKKTLP
jgi:hypothetical protein